MNKYEIMFIVKSTMESADVKKCAETFKKLVESLKGKVVEYKELGSKKLAYPINKEVSGFYYVFNFEANNDIINELNRKARINENIIRHLIIKLDEE